MESNDAKKRDLDYKFFINVAIKIKEKYISDTLRGVFNLEFHGVDWRVKEIIMIKNNNI